MRQDDSFCSFFLLGSLSSWLLDSLFYNTKALPGYSQSLSRLNPNLFQPKGSPISPEKVSL